MYWWLPVAAAGIIARAPIGIHPNDHRRRRWLRDDYSLWLRCLRRTGLHRGNHTRADALLLKDDQILGLQGDGHAVGADIVEDEFFVHTRSGHLDDVARSDAGIDLGRLGGHRLMTV